MRNRIITGIFITLFLAIALYWFFYTKEARTPINNGINAIPTDAALIFESKQATDTWKKLSSTNIMWEELIGSKAFENVDLQAKCIDSLLQLDPLIPPLLDQHSVFLSIHPDKKNSFNLLFVYSLPNLTYRDEVQEFLEKINQKEIIYNNYENEKIGVLTIPGKPNISFSIVSGILIMSAENDLVQSSIHQLASGVSLEKDRSFNKIFNTAGKKVDANVYINYKTFPKILTEFTNKDTAPNVDALLNFADYSGWDVTIKPNALMLNGFTYSNDSTKKNYLNIFNKQHPQPIDLTEIIPSKTAFMCFYGISNMTAFRQDHKKYLKANSRLSDYENFLNANNEKYHTDLEEQMFSWPANEMALVITEPSSPDYSDNSFAVFHSTDINTALKVLHSLSDSVNHIDQQNSDTTNFRGHSIGRLNTPRLLAVLFGNQFNKVNGGYYTSIGDHIIFGNSVNALSSFINDFENNKILANDKNYKAFAENISSDASIYIYSAIARSTELYRDLIRHSFADDITAHLDLFHKFEAAGIQFSFNDKLYYSNIYLKYNPEYKQETSTLWETKLDTTLSSKPYLLINHNTKAKEVLVQDDANKIYLISNTGKLIWTKQLNEKLMSDVIQVDVLKNNKLQMVFNTRSYIYMFDRNGNDMKGFPVKLESPATNAISVVDYENNRDYRIFIACEDRSILCYKPDGEKVSGFTPAKTENAVYLPVQYFSASNKDHLCAIDCKGKVYIYDRHGIIRVKMKEQMAQGIRNFYIEPGRDYTKTFITASDTLGNILKLNLAGDKQKIKLQDFETSPYFDFHDIDNDKQKEYIFLTRNELKVFKPDNTLIFNYTFASPITQAPQCFLFPDGSGKIGITSEASNELFLFNDNGSLFNTFPLNGKTNFSIGDLNNEGILNLVTGSADNSIYVYQLK